MSSISELGNKKFRLDFRLFGHRFRKVFSTEHEAIEFKLLLDERLTAKQVLLLDAVNFYLEQISSRKKLKSRHVDKNALYALIAQIGEGKVIREIKPHHLEEYRTSELRRGVKQSTVNRKFNTVKHFFKICETWEYIDKSPARNISSLGVTYSRFSNLLSFFIPFL